MVINALNLDKTIKNVNSLNESANGKATSDYLPTVEKRTPIGVFFPTSENTLALQYLVMSWVTSKYPKAPAIASATVHCCIYTTIVNTII